MSLFETPILVIAYRRLEKAQRLYEVLSRLKPARLYVFADGPKDENEKFYCSEVRKLFDRAAQEWDCQLSTCYLPAHSGGCTQGVSGALKWFFSHEEEGIILEDDCIPNMDFFSYCQFYLDRFRKDERVFQISGTNLLDKLEGTHAPMLSQFFIPPWGWATWKRSWTKYDLDLSLWKKHKDVIRQHTHAHAFWERVYADNEQTAVSWDLQWMLMMWLNNAYSIIPPVNLVLNIGFDKYATLTSNPDNPINRQRAHRINEPFPEPVVLPEADMALEKKIIEWVDHL